MVIINWWQSYILSIHYDSKISKSISMWNHFVSSCFNNILIDLISLPTLVYSKHVWAEMTAISINSCLFDLNPKLQSWDLVSGVSADKYQV